VDVRAQATRDGATVAVVLPGVRDLLPLAAAYPARYPCLLESVSGSSKTARYDILFALPQESIELRPESTERFLDKLDNAWRNASSDERDTLPFHGGWLLFLSYELAAEIEPSLHRDSESNLPIALAVRCPAAIVVDRIALTTTFIVESAFASSIDQLRDDLDSAVESCDAFAIESVDEDDPQKFLDGVARIHDYLRDGDTFQVNLSREWRATCAHATSPAAIYRRLRKVNPSPFAALLQWNGWAVVSSSPERLVEVRNGIAQTRPIAGTRPRSNDDAERIHELITNPKERAEHVMLIDLERNDLGRVCEAGSIHVDELMSVESYAHVHHIVSNVRGRLRANISPGEVIRAVFPGGTITGCPKVRCMEIIAELEGVERGAYTGALGYLDRNGDMDLNILIRTLTLCEGSVRLRAGAGIVADSDAERELEETRAKARGLLRALGAHS
jgi:anthranilate synthase component 1